MGSEDSAWQRHKIVAADGREHVAVGAIAYAAIGHGAGMQMMTFTDEDTREVISLPTGGTKVTRIPPAS